MAGPVTRDEFDELVREVEGEKIVTRHILEQTRRNGDDLAAVKSRLDRHDQRFDLVEREIRGLRNEIRGLPDELPTIVGDVVREALRERERVANSPGALGTWLAAATNVAGQGSMSTAAPTSLERRLECKKSCSCAKSSKPYKGDVLTGYQVVPGPPRSKVRWI